MEACGGAHFWGREIGKLGHEVRLIPPAYVKPFVMRQKNDAADAKAICEAAQRPTMRFVPVKSEGTQGAAMVFRIRELLIRQRTQMINALRGHLGEFGQIVPQGAANAARLISIVEDPNSGLPADATATLKGLVGALTHVETEISKLDAEIARRAKENEIARRLMTVPGIGPSTATAIAVLAPPPETFRKARDFAAWLGLTPRQHSTGGKQRLGAAAKMGERSLRRLLIVGANSVIIKRHVHAAALVHAILQESPRKRAARTRADTPALLKGLLFGPDGAAFSPTHTRNGGRLYRYYVSQTVLKLGAGSCPVGRVPAGDIEAAVVDQLRAVFRQPEIVAGTWKAARTQDDDITEADARAALQQLDPLWNELFPAEQARIVGLAIERVDIAVDSVNVRLRMDGLSGLAREMLAGGVQVAA